MRHGSLFSGIGGFDLAAEWMGWDNIFHCEWNPFGKRVLNYYWPKAISYDDITKTDFTIHRGRIDILTGGFPCQPYSAAGKDSEKKMNAIYGQRCLEQYGKFSRPGLWGKTFAALLIGMEGWYSTRCKLTWSLRATKSSRFYFQLVPLTHPTEGTEFGLLPTPAAQNHKGASSTEALEKRGRLKDKGDNLVDHFAQSGKSAQLNPRFLEEMMGFPDMWTDPLSLKKKQDPTDENEPTPSVSIEEKDGKMELKGLLPTPTATDWKGAYPPTSIENNPARKHMMRNVYQYLEGPYHSINSQLNPLFVNEMMGFPIGYLDI